MPVSRPSPPAIDVISDVVCPWCFIGKRRLDEALRQSGMEGASVRWHPFELNPDLPLEGLDRRAYLEAKFGGAVNAAATYARVREAGASTGIAFQFERIARQPNTRAAHRLVGWWQEQGNDASALMERLFHAYFLDGLSLVGESALVDIAAEAGVDAAEARDMLASGAGDAEVAAAERRAQAIGVSGVPFFVFGRRVGVSGAQAVDLLVEALQQAGAESEAHP